MRAFMHAREGPDPTGDPGRGSRIASPQLRGVPDRHHTDGPMRARPQVTIYLYRGSF